MNQKEVIIKVTDKQVRDQLGKLISPTFNKEQILDTLMYHICKESPGLENLYMSLQGIDFTPQYKLNQEFYVKISRLGSWQFDTTNTLVSDLSFQGRLTVKIKDVNKYSTIPYIVEFKAVDTLGKTVSLTYAIAEIHLEEKESIEIPPF